MLNFSNTSDLTLAERRIILDRAVSSQPYFELLDFNVIAGTEKDRQYQAKLNVNKDFWITDVKGNFNDVLDATQTEFWMSIWTAYRGESIHKYIRGVNLPPSFQCYDARFNLPFVNQRYADIQDEILPYKIAKGSSVIASTDNQSAKIAEGDIKVVLAGFFALERNYINERTQEGINESLSSEPYFELWKITVNTEGKSNHVFDNDRFARLVLGFGAVDLSVIRGDLAESEITITDNVRGLRFNSKPIPVQYFAPRLTALRDTHINYLPTEHLLEPFANIRVEAETQLNGGNGYDLYMLTRTV